MKAFGWTADFVRLKLTSAQGWAYYAWAMENEMSVWGGLYEAKSDNYIAQERKKILSKK